MPLLSPDIQTLFRMGYGVLLLGTLLSLLPNLRAFFFGEKWGGYARSSRLVNFLQNPTVFSLVYVLWIASAGCLVLGRFLLPAAICNLAACHVFFIHQRWGSLLRGMGAPGFMAWWCAVAVFLLEFTSAFAPQSRSLALLVLQIDFAVIMLSSGLYKAVSGYPRGTGMELGLINPMWSYFRGLYSRLSPTHWIFFLLNQLAWTVEILAATLMIIPPARPWGALLLAGSFLFLLTQIRLNWLCEMVIACCLLFVPQGTRMDEILGSIVPPSAAIASEGSLPPVFELFLNACLWGYLVLRPAVFAGLCYNFYLGKAFLRPLQWALEKYANLFGIILWRVFTKEVTDFFIEIERRSPDGSTVRVSRYECPTDFRYNHVAEAIAVATLFTTLKYFPHRPDLFEERLVRYSRTLPYRRGDVFSFRYVVLKKGLRRFETHPVLEVVVDPIEGRVDRKVLNEALAQELKLKSYAAQDCIRPGSYVPVGG